MPEWISVTEAARTTGYSIYHLRDLIKAGVIKAEKVITVWRIDRASLAAYVRQRSKRGKKRGPKKRV